MDQQTARVRLQSAGISPEQLFWLNDVGSRGALDELPGDAILLPGEDTLTTETLIDLTDGQTVMGSNPVPEATVYGRLAELQPFLRRQASAAYTGQAGLSADGSVTRGAADQGGTIGSTAPSTGQTRQG